MVYSPNALIVLNMVPSYKVQVYQVIDIFRSQWWGGEAVWPDDTVCRADRQS